MRKDYLCMLPFNTSVLIDNSPMERTNRTIKQLFYNSFGFSNFHRTRKRIIYIFSSDTPLLDVSKLIK